MSDPGVSIRRSTLDDLPALRGLWSTALYSPPELERFLTSFFLVEGGAGRLMGAFAFEARGSEACVHHLAWTHPGAARAAAPHLAERIGRLARGQGLHRVWFPDQRPFWEECGLDLRTRGAPESAYELLRGAACQWSVWFLIPPEEERRIEREVRRFEESRDRERDRLRQGTRSAVRFLWLLVLLLSALLFWSILGWLGIL